MQATPTPTLVVLLHGLRGDAAQMAGVGELARVAIPGAAVISPEYRARITSNANPARVAAGVDEEIERYHEHWRARHVVLVGYGIGAELLRRSYLDARDRGAAWSRAVDRLVLVGAVREGWTVSPAQTGMSRRMRLAIRLARLIGRLTGLGRLARAFERGAPFVTELEARWRSLEEHGGTPMMVELVGEKDDVLARDGEGEVAVRRNAAIVRVRRSTNRDILAVDVRADGNDPETWRRADDPRRERRAALHAALTAPAVELRALARRRMPRDVIPLPAGYRGSGLGV